MNLEMLVKVRLELESLAAVYAEEQLLVLMRRSVRLQISSRREALAARVAEERPFAQFRVNDHVLSHGVRVVERPVADVTPVRTELPAVLLYVQQQVGLRGELTTADATLVSDDFELMKRRVLAHEMHSEGAPRLEVLTAMATDERAFPCMGPRVLLEAYGREEALAAEPARVWFRVMHKLVVRQAVGAPKAQAADLTDEVLCAVVNYLVIKQALLSAERLLTFDAGKPFRQSFQLLVSCF